MAAEEDGEDGGNARRDGGRGAGGIGEVGGGTTGGCG